MGCPVQFFHNLDDTQPTTRLLKNATRFSRLSSWLTLQTNSQDVFPQDSAVLPTGINSDYYDERRHFVIFNGWQQITLRNYTELDTLQKIGITRPFIPPLDTRAPPGRHPGLVPDDRPHPTHTRPPDATRPPPFTSPTPKVARNSATRKFNTAHKRCNTNGLVSKFERFTWNYVRHFRATTPILGRRPPDTQASYPTTAHSQPTPRPHPAHASPTPPFTAPPQKSHVIRLPENSTPPTNVAIPTV